MEHKPKEKNSLWIPGRVIPKKRPRVVHGKAYMPKIYTDWQQNNLPLVADLCLPYPCHIDCSFINFALGDVDNLEGSILDLFVKGGALENDSSSYVTGTSSRFLKIKKKRGQDKVVGALIRWQPSEIITINYGDIFELLV